MKTVDIIKLVLRLHISEDLSQAKTKKFDKKKFVKSAEKAAKVFDREEKEQNERRLSGTASLQI